MNCESAQQGILLHHTGELSTGQEHELLNHLEKCEACRQYKTGMERISALAKKALPTPEPSRETIERILAAGSRAAGRNPPLLFRFPTALRLAAAAGFLLLAAGYCLLVFARERTDVASHHLRVTQISTIMTMVTEEEEMESAAASNGATKPDIRALARQILLVEGLAAEELTENEELILYDDAPTRDLQSRSTFDSHPTERA